MRLWAKYIVITIDSPTFDGLNSLYWLTLSSNQLTKIDPSTFNGLNSLEILRLGNNKLTTIDPWTQFTPRIMVKR
jgi:Leucine-rich repeat (LRR) protein